MTAINNFNSGVPSYTPGSAPQPAPPVVTSTEAPRKVVQEEEQDPASLQAQAQAQAQPQIKGVLTALNEQTEENNNVQDAQGNSKTVNDEIKKAVDAINKKMLSHSEAIFGIHDKTNRVTIKIVDKDTKKVIKELPPEKTLDMLARVWEMAGILVDEKR